MGRHVVATALRTAGYAVEVHDDHFDQETKDTQWCGEVGAKGWIIITKDKQIRCNRIELQCLLSAGVPCFCLNSADMKGGEMCETLLKALPTMLRMAEKYQSPFVASVSRGGGVTFLHGHDGLLRRIGEVRDAQANRERIDLWPK